MRIPQTIMCESPLSVNKQEERKTMKNHGDEKPRSVPLVFLFATEGDKRYNKKEYAHHLKPQT